jgi:hypothetical protein
MKLGAKNMNNKDPRIISASILTQPDGQRYILMVDMAAVLHGFSSALEQVGLVDGQAIADELRIIARQLEARPEGDQ